MKLFKGFTIYADDFKHATRLHDNEQDTRNEMKQQQQATTRYYKKDGIKFGEYGKLFTTIEEHGGIKEQYIRIFEECGKIEIKNN